MKNMLKKVIVLAIVAVMFVMPASTALAASTPTLKVELPGYKYFKYEPTPFFLQNGYSVILEDTTTYDGRFYVEAGKPFHLDIGLDGTGWFRVIIAYDNTNYNTGTISSNMYSVVLPPLDHDTRYQIWVTAYSNFGVETYQVTVPTF